LRVPKNHSAHALNSERRKAKRELSDEVRALRLELVEAQSLIHELRAVVSGKIVDLPARRVN
jgi:hypothetical protein